MRLQYSSEIPCHIIGDLHERLYDLLTVSNTNLVKSKAL